MHSPIFSHFHHSIKLEISATASFILHSMIDALRIRRHWRSSTGSSSRFDLKGLPLLLHPSLRLQSLKKDTSCTGPCQGSRRGHSSHTKCHVASPQHISPLASVLDYDPSPKEVQRRQRLKNLLKLRGVYRDVLSANAFLDLPSPVYGKQGVYEPASVMDGKQGDAAASDDLASDVQPSREELERERSYQALMLVAEMQLLADRLRVSFVLPSLAPP